MGLGNRYLKGRAIQQNLVTIQNVAAEENDGPTETCQHFNSDWRQALDFDFGQKCR
jgi:hypothetical protein